MKRIIKSRIFTFILGAIIFGSISGVVAYTYRADQITYIPSDNTWNVTNVKDAVDGLYTKANTTISGLNNQISTLENTIQDYENNFNLRLNEKLATELTNNITYNHSGGTRLANRSTSINLNAGEYLLFGNIGYIGRGDNITQLNSEYNPSLTYSNGSCNKIFANYYDYSGTTSIAMDNGQIYLRELTRDIIYRCTFNSSTTVMLTNSSVDNSQFGETVKLYSINLN